MNPFLIKVPLDSPNYLGLTFDKHFSSDELAKFQHVFKGMADYHCHVPNIQSVCRFMQLHLLNHERFPAYLMTPTALQISTMGLHQPQSHQPFVNTTLSATCLLSKSEFIRFTIQGHEAAGLWVRNNPSNQHKKGPLHLPFNVNLHHNFGDKSVQLRLFGDTLASETQRLLIQVVTLLAFGNTNTN